MESISYLPRKEPATSASEPPGFGPAEKELAPPGEAAESAPPGAERVAALDLVRGVAVLGILPVNIGWFFLEQGSWLNPWAVGAAAGDRWVAALTWFFFEQKFITLFSILFGAGLAIRFDRARAHGEPFAGRLLRRQAVLLVVGIAHVNLLFYGDILTTYALIGSFAWLACGQGQRALLGLAAVCFTGACAVWCWIWVSPHGVGGLAYPVAQRWYVLAGGLLAPDIPARVRHLGMAVGPDPPWGELAAERLGEAAYFTLTAWIIYGFYVLACFLLGMHLLRHGIFHEPAAQSRCLSGMILAGLAVGIPLNAAYVLVHARDARAPYLTLLVGVAAPPLALAYLGLLVRWSASGWLPWLQRWLRATGRMALTNYLMQSVFLYLLLAPVSPLKIWAASGREISRAGALIIVVLIWLYEVARSAAWLRLFRMGPAEWLWRRLAGERTPAFVRPPGEPTEVT